MEHAYEYEMNQDNSRFEDEQQEMPDMSRLSVACRKLRVLLDRKVSDAQALRRCAEIDRGL